MTRDRMSVPPPGANGEINRIGLVGYFWAYVSEATAETRTRVTVRSATFICSSSQPVIVPDLSLLRYFLRPSDEGGACHAHYRQVDLYRRDGRRPGQRGHFQRGLRSG